MVLFNLVNNDVPFFQDKKIRLALMNGLNRQWMVDYILQGQAVVADSPLLPLTWAFYDGVGHIGFDSDAAVSQLKVAGYVLPPDGTTRAKDNISLTFTMVYPDNSCMSTGPGHSAKLGCDWRGAETPASLVTNPCSTIF